MRKPTLQQSLLLAVYLLLVPVYANTSCAQWKKVFQFSDAARSIYFLDRIGHPETGFVGLENGELWRTVDTGATWQKVITDADGLSVCDISFKDAMTGWFITEPFFGQSGPSKVFNTTDGGLTWNVLLQDAGGSFAAIYYHAPANILLLSNWQRGGFASSDEGSTWNVFTTQVPLNGYAFSDDRNGIASFAGVQPSTMMQTLDGGKNWQTLSIPQTAGWQPAAIAGTTTFFVFSEYTSTLSRSDDNGVSWIPIKSLPLTPGGQGNLGVSGCLRNTQCNQLFIQTTTDGFYTSTDLGVDWTAIGGPPNEADTRFWIDQNTVYASDYQGALWAYASALPVTSVIPQLRIVNSSKHSELSFSFSADILASEGFDSLSFDLKFNPDMLHLDSAIAASGLILTMNETQPGSYHFILDNRSHSDILADNDLVLFYFSSTVTIDTASPVYVNTGTAFFDPRKHSGCSESTLTLDGGGDTVILQAADSCGDGSLRHFMATGTIEYRIVSIRPNPTEAQIVLQTESSSTCDATIRIFDASGKEYLHLKKVLKGAESWVLPTSELPAGAYQLMISSATGSISTDFIKVR